MAAAGGEGANVMDCPNCGTGHPIITKTNILPDGDERRCWCPACKYVWWTVECIREHQEHQAFQASLFRAMCYQHERENGQREP